MISSPQLLKDGLLPAFPKSIQPSQLAVLCPSPYIPGYIGSGESVVLSSGSIGRILRVHACLPFEYRTTTSMSTTQIENPVFELQLYLPSTEFSNWYPMDEDTLCCGSGLHELVETNKTLWVSCDDVKYIAFILYAEDVRNHTYGPVAGRDHFYVVRKRVLLDSRLGEVSREDIEEDDYFLGGGRGVESLSERLLFGFMHECNKSIKMLWRAGKMIKRSQTISEPKSKEQWLYETTLLSEKDGMETELEGRKRARVLKVARPDLRAQSTVYTTKVQKVSSSTQSGFDGFRSVFSSVFGTGVKKGFPSRKYLRDFRMNPAPLVIHDILNCVDVNFSTNGSVEIDRDARNDIFMGLNNKNEITMEWCPKKRTCKTTIRATPCVVSRASNEVMSYLRNNNATTHERSGTDRVFLGMAIWGEVPDSDTYRVVAIKIDEEAQEVATLQRESENGGLDRCRTAKRTVLLEYCIENEQG